MSLGLYRMVISWMVTAAPVHPLTVLSNNLVDLVNVRITQPQTKDDNLVDVVNIRVTQSENEDNFDSLSNNFVDYVSVPTLGSTDSSENEYLNNDIYDDIFEEEKKKDLDRSISETAKEKSERSELLSDFVNVRIPISIAILDLSSIKNENAVMTPKDDNGDTVAVTEIVLQTTTTDAEDDTIENYNPEDDTIENYNQEDDTIENYNPCVSVNAAHFGKTLQASFPLEDPWRVIPLKFTIQECWQECQNNQECKFWNFVDQTYGGILPERFIGSCYLKSGIVKQPKPIKGYVAGTRDCFPLDSQ